MDGGGATGRGRGDDAGGGRPHPWDRATLHAGAVGSAPIGGWRVLTPPVVDGHNLEALSLRVDFLIEALPPIIFGGAEVRPERSAKPRRFGVLWSYGDLFTVVVTELEEQGRINVRFQSMAVALWTSHRAYLEAVAQVAEAMEATGLHSTRVDVCVDVEGLDVTHHLIDYCVGHRGSIRYDAKRGRQIELGVRAGAKRFVRIYVKSLMECSTYMPTWKLHGNSGGVVVRVEVEFKGGGLPSREPAWYLDGDNVAALYGDAVVRYRVVETPENSLDADPRKVGRRSRAATHPAWLALTEDPAKWMRPPDPVWTAQRRLDVAREKLAAALGSIAARMEHKHAEMESIDETLAVLRALQSREPVPAAKEHRHADGLRVVVVGPARSPGLDDRRFEAARKRTVKREGLLRGLALERDGPLARPEPPASKAKAPRLRPRGGGSRDLHKGR